jgi:hypothetical protein
VRRKGFAGQGWAGRDFAVAAGFIVLLALSGADPRLLYAALGYAVVVLVVVAARLVARRHREQANADAPFWADRIADREPDERR